MNKIKLFILFFCTPAFVIAQPGVKNPYLQKFTEIGLQAGVAGYAGDLGGALGSEGFRNFSPGHFRPAFSINATHRMATWASLRPSLMVGKIAGDDAILEEGSSSDPNLGNRNLSFRSVIAELAITADVNPLYLFSSYAQTDHRFYPYASIGLGAFYYNPQANLNGTWHDLKPLRLEGQGFPQYPASKQYSRVNFSIPMGAGFKYYVSTRHYLGAEGMVRRTFTDYLDDVSRNYIDPAYFDAYLSTDEAALAKQLHHRNTSSSFVPGGQRGNPGVKDYFFTVSLRFGMILDSKVF